jgi:hypothetical protein
MELSSSSASCSIRRIQYIMAPINTREKEIIQMFCESIICISYTDDFLLYFIGKLFQISWQLLSTGPY